MLIAVLQFELDMPWAQSLKDKRRVTRAVKDTLTHRLRVSVAEVAQQDVLNRATIALACVGSDGRVLGTVLDKALSIMQQMPDVHVVASRRDVIAGVDVEADAGPDRAPLTEDDRARITREMLGTLEPEMAQDSAQDNPADVERQDRGARSP